MAENTRQRENVPMLMLMEQQTTQMLTYIVKQTISKGSYNTMQQFQLPIDIQRY